jgi:tetratricopeptide (TPR) repeat protein
VPFRGNCLVHRCELMRLRGSWGEALQAATDACSYLSGPVSWDSLGSAYYQLAEVQRLRGDFDEAEQNYRLGNEAGHRPEPGIALLRLAQGRSETAAAMLRRALEETTDPPTRARLLPAQVDVMLDAGDVDTAETAAEELAQLAHAIDAPYLRALAASTEGAVALAKGEPRRALPRLRAAADLWRELDCPHELAKTRVRIGVACLELEDTETAEMELDGCSRHADAPRSKARPRLGRGQRRGFAAGLASRRPDGPRARRAEAGCQGPHEQSHRPATGPFGEDGRPAHQQPARPPRPPLARRGHGVRLQHRLL